jgi:hypothetical protein
METIINDPHKNECEPSFSLFLLLCVISFITMKKIKTVELFKTKLSEDIKK